MVVVDSSKTCKAAYNNLKDATNLNSKDQLTHFVHSIIWNAI